MFGRKILGLDVKAALNHSDVSVTQEYLDVGEDAVAAAIARCDFTKGPRKRGRFHCHARRNRLFDPERRLAHLDHVPLTLTSSVFR